MEYRDGLEKQSFCNVEEDEMRWWKRLKMETQRMKEDEHKSPDVKEHFLNVKLVKLHQHHWQYYLKTI